jgi:hypothetical protein
VRRAIHSGRGGRCVTGWFSVRGLFAMQCAKNKVFIKPLALARAGCIRAVRCAAQDAM